MEDATRILDAGTQDYPLDASASQSAEDCPHCSTNIAPGKMFCPGCGYQRNTWAASSAAAASQAQSAPSEDRGPAIFEIIDDAGNCYGLPDGESVLGRGVAEISIADGYLSRRHAVFTVSAGKLSFSDLGSANGSFVGDLKLERDVPHSLIDGQKITLGKLGFTVRALQPEHASEDNLTATEADYSDVSVELASDSDISQEAAEVLPADPPHVASGWCLEHSAHGTLDIPLGVITLGRSAGKADIPISGDGYVSGLHGRLTASADALSFEDLGSTNGSLVNDEPAAANLAIELREGDKLQLGQTEFVVSRDSAELGADEIEGNSDEPGLMA